MSQGASDIAPRMPPTRLAAERRVFDCLRFHCTVSAQQEYELAIHTLVERYNTTIYENRFVVGEAVELFTYALLRSVGIDCTLYGDQAMAGDILLPRDRKLSVKSNFVGVTSIRLLNKMGEGDRERSTATLFIVANVGIVFGAPDMVDFAHIRSTGDALILRAQGLRSLKDNPANVIPMEITKKPPQEATLHSLKASTAVARQILSEMQSSDLLNAISPPD